MTKTELERLAVVEALLQEIKDNHLPHLEREILGLRNWIIGALFSACLSLFVLLVNIGIQLLN